MRARCLDGAHDLVVNLRRLERARLGLLKLATQLGDLGQLLEQQSLPADSECFVCLERMVTLCAIWPTR